MGPTVILCSKVCSDRFSVYHDIWPMTLISLLDDKNKRSHMDNMKTPRHENASLVPGPLLWDFFGYQWYPIKIGPAMQNSYIFLVIVRNNLLKKKTVALRVI